MYTFDIVSRPTLEALHQALAVRAMIRTKDRRDIEPSVARQVSKWFSDAFRVAIPADIMAIVINHHQIQHLCSINFSNTEAFIEIVGQQLHTMLSAFYTGSNLELSTEALQSIADKINPIILEHSSDLRTTLNPSLQHLKYYLEPGADVIRRISKLLDSHFSLNIPTDVISNIAIEPELKRAIINTEPTNTISDELLNDIKNRVMRFYFGVTNPADCHTAGIEVTTQFKSRQFDITNILLQQQQNGQIDVTDELQIIKLNQQAA